MRVVGIKQLKARLSEYIREVRRGEVFLVTDRDQIVAELGPARRAAAPPTDPTEQVLEALAESGELQLPTLAKGDFVWKPRGAGLAPGTADRVIENLRQERAEPPR